MSSDERTPLLWAQNSELGDNPHDQFCALVGVPPSISNFNPSSKDAKHAAIKHQIYKNSLYGRVTDQLSSQRRAYNFSASLNNTLLLSQVILGAVLTGLGAAITNLPTSTSGPILVTVFGAMNTVIAGLVAYLKSRGQPMRARMYRDDLERVLDEIENSEVMWRGIAAGVHGYDDIDTETQVTVRSEVARLTRLYERAVRNNTVNNPDMYMSGGGSDGSATGLRNRALPNQSVALPAVVPAAASGAVTGGETSAAPVAPSVPAAADPDQSPASAPLPPKDPPKKEEEGPDKKEEQSTDAAKDDASKEDKGKAAESSGSGSGPASTPAPAPAPVPPNLMDDPDASPASAAVLHRHSSKDDAPKKVKGDDD